jgi:tetratricopeptide (TPR) repeat protein
VQLLRAAKESHLWGGSYQNEILEVKDIFKIQSEIAESIASKLKAILTPREKELIEKIPTSNMEAWEAYLKGRYYWSRLSEKDMETAMKYFELAKEKDPDFALAYAGIGSVWIGWRQMGLVVTADATPKADEAVNKALEIDKDLADVQYMLAVEFVWGKYDWKGGEAAFRKTLELNPNHAEAHAYYSHLLNIEGRRVEAMNHIETALKLDPLSPLIKALYGIDLMFLRRYDDAIKAYQKSLEINPTQGVAANNIVIALYFAGREDEAIERQSAGINIKSPEGLKAWNEGADSAGFRGANKKLAQFRAKRAQVTHSQTYGVALRYALAGDIDNTIYWLEKVYEERDPNLPYLLLPTWDNLRDDPRFQEIARKMNLPYK